MCQWPLSEKQDFSTECQNSVTRSKSLSAFGPGRMKGFTEISEIIIVKINVPLYLISACVKWNRSVFDECCPLLCKLL